MKNSGWISVIIPVYNVEKYLRECVDSVLNQTWKNLEIILVDDGSTEGSAEICEAYAEEDDRVQIIHQKNGGLSVARNQGFAASTGEYVYFLDSDDWIEKDTLEQLTGKAREQQAQAVFFDAVSFDESGNLYKSQRYARNIDYGAGCGMEIFAESQKNGDYHSAVPLLFMKREYLVGHNLFFEPNIYFEDMIFTFQVFCLAERVAHVNRRLYHRRYRSGSITEVKKTSKYYYSSMTVYERVKAFINAQKLQCDAAKRYLIRCAFNTMNVYCSMTKSEKRLCRNAYLALKCDVIQHYGFGSKSLYARCYGRLPWMITRSLEKMGIL